MCFFSFLISRDIISRQSKHNWNYPCTNLLLSRPGLRGRASISIGPQADAATGPTTGMADQAPRMKEDWRRKKESSCSLYNREEIQIQSDFSPSHLIVLAGADSIAWGKNPEEKKSCCFDRHTVLHRKTAGFSNWYRFISNFLCFAVT